MEPRDDVGSGAIGNWALLKLAMTLVRLDLRASGSHIREPRYNAPPNSTLY